MESSVDTDLLLVALCNIARARFFSREADHLRPSDRSHLMALVAVDRRLVARALVRSSRCVARPVACGHLRVDPNLASLMHDFLDPLLDIALISQR